MSAIVPATVGGSTIETSGAAHAVVQALPTPPDATEEQLIELWLHGKSPNMANGLSHDGANEVRVEVIERGENERCKRRRAGIGPKRVKTGRQVGV